jgi:predicted TIM-barrel fold metal-dependent hydrolase
VRPAIDTHAHVIADDTRRYPLAPLGGSQSDWSRTRPVSDGKMVVAMQEAGVSRTILVQASTCYGHDNSYVADAVAAHPQEFRGVFSVDMTAPDARDQIGRWTGRGLSGLRVFIAGHTTAHSARLDDPRSFPAWQYAVDHGLPVCVQVRAAGLPQLEVLLERFPQAIVLLDHMARPAVDDGPPYPAASSLFALARYRNLFLKLTTHNLRDASQGKATPAGFLARVIDAFGAERIAWGSNYPAAEGALAALLAEARQALAARSEPEREWIFSRTAEGLYLR